MVNCKVTFFIKGFDNPLMASVPSNELEEIKNFLLGTTHKGYITVNGGMINANEIAVMTWEEL